MENVLSFLEKRESQKEVLENNMRGSQLDIEKIVSRLTALSVEVTELRKDNSELKVQNTKLEAANNFALP